MEKIESMIMKKRKIRVMRDLAKMAKNSNGMVMCHSVSLKIISAPIRKK